MAEGPWWEVDFGCKCHRCEDCITYETDIAYEQHRVTKYRALWESIERATLEDSMLEDIETEYLKLQSRKGGQHAY